MKRWFLTLIALWAVSLAQAAEPKRVLLIETMPVQAVTVPAKAFVEQLRAKGWGEDQLKIERFEAQGSREKARQFTENALKQGHVDLAVTVATYASQGAFEPLRKQGVPQLFFTVADPVGAGLVGAVGVPSGTNVTGLVYTVPRNTKLKVVMPLLRQAFDRRPIKIALIHTDYPSELGDARKLALLSLTEKDIEFVMRQIKYHKVPEQTEKMMVQLRRELKDLRGQVDGIWSPQGGLGQTAEFAKTVVDSGIPLVYAVNTEAVEYGALLYLDPSYEATARDAAFYGDQILRGKDPGSLPVAYPTQFKLAVNLTTALNMGVVLPRHILKMAGQNLYR